MKNLLIPLFTIITLFHSLNMSGQKWDLTLGSPVHPRDIIEFNGELYAAGNWSSGYQSFIVKWNGTSWTAVGEGFIESTETTTGIYSLEIFNGELYAGGFFSIDIGGSVTYNLIKWDGTSWEAVTDFPNSSSFRVYDLGLFNGNIMIGGKFFGQFGTGTDIQNIIGHNGTDWVPFNQGVYDGDVLSMEEHNGEFYIAGKFNRDGATTDFINNLAKWDGANSVWLDINNLTAYSGNGYFDKILSFGDHIYLYTIKDDIFNNFPKLIKWDLNAEIIEINTVSVSPEYSRLAHLSDMIVFEGNLIVSGNFVDSPSIGGNSTPTQIESYDGMSWNKALPEGPTANALGIYNDRLTNGSYVLNDPSVSVSATETMLCVNVTTDFSYEDFSSNSISTISWTFEGGTPTTSTDESPSVSYAAPGTFDVSVSVTSSDGTTELTFSDMITVGAEFTVDAGEDVTINYGEELSLVGTPAGGTWSGSQAIQGDIFDGGFSSGEFTITYTVTENGCTQTDSKVVTVEKNDPGAYDFSSIPDDLVYPVSDGIVLPFISTDVMYAVVSGPATISTSNATQPTLTISGAGEITIEVTQPETISTFERTDSHTFNVAKGNHIITINSIEDQVYGDVFFLRFGSGFDFESSSTSNAGLYDVNILSGPATADNEDNLQEITITGVGTVSFEIVSFGNDNWNPAPTVQGTFEAIKAPQTITASSTIAAEYSYSLDVLDFSQLITSSTGLPVVFVITAGPGFFSGDEMDQYNFVSTGQVTVTAFASGNENYESSPNLDVSFTVVKGDQTITWKGFDEVEEELPNSIVYNPDGYSPFAETDSGLALEYSVVSGDGSVSNGTFHITASGNFTLNAVQSGDENWNASSSEYSFTVAKASQTISFNEIEDQVRNESGFEFIPISSSGLEVSIQSLTGRTVYNGTMVTFNFASAGREELLMNQQGNANYLPANQEEAIFCISAPAPALTIANQNGSQIEITSDNSIDDHEFFRDGESIGVFTGGLFSFNETGTYTAIALAEDGCPSSGLSNGISFEVLGTNDHLFEIYPNPMANRLHLKSDIPIHVILLSIDGKEIHNQWIDREESIDVSRLDPGQYLLQAYSKGNLIEARKIIKNN